MKRINLIKDALVQYTDRYIVVESQNELDYNINLKSSNMNNTNNTNIHDWTNLCDRLAVMNNITTILPVPKLIHDSKIKTIVKLIHESNSHHGLQLECDTLCTNIRILININKFPQLKSRLSDIVIKTKTMISNDEIFNKQQEMFLNMNIDTQQTMIKDAISEYRDILSDRVDFLNKEI